MRIIFTYQFIRLSISLKWNKWNCMSSFLVLQNVHVLIFPLCGLLPNLVQEKEEVFRQISEGTNGKVFWWAVVQTSILLTVGFWQMKRLKDFFIAKKLVWWQILTCQYFTCFYPCCVSCPQVSLFLPLRLYCNLQQGCLLCAGLKTDKQWWYTTHTM